MARTPSNMLALHTPAPDFSLPEPATGQTVQLSDFAGQPVLVAFICNHCPFVIHIQKELAEMAREYQQRGVAVVAINANDVANYPDDSPEKMMKVSKLPVLTMQRARRIYICLMPNTSFITVDNLMTRVQAMRFP